MTKTNLEEIVTGELGQLKVINATNTYTVISSGSRNITLRPGDTFSALSTHSYYTNLVFHSCDLSGIINLTDRNALRLDRLVAIYKY